MEINWIALLLAALSTLVVGFIWYNPKVFGAIWMKETGIKMEGGKPNGSEMAKLLGISLIYAFMISIILQFNVIHQFGAFSMTGGDILHAKPSYNAFMADYIDAFRTFKHGAFHGFLVGLLLALPMIGTNSLYEKRSFKYVLVTGGYWIVCFTIMGGIICSMK
ncbi:DUF1761 domain-containing protein [Flavobacterium sp.]|uniref:DUF1761 domain-containing protein n=1 Tax=Flavobacterium sp. TaxID=239 RepID=UPI0037A01200